MDEIEKRFIAFLEKKETMMILEKIARSLLIKLTLYELGVLFFQSHQNETEGKLGKQQFEDLTGEMVQMIFEFLLQKVKKKNWSKILEMPNSQSYIKAMFLNHLRDGFMSRKDESPGRYYRKRVIDSLRSSDRFFVFNHFEKKGKSMMCYVRKPLEGINPSFLTEPLINGTPFQDCFVEPTIDSVKTKKRIVEMADFFLAHWEHHEEKNLCLKVDDLLLWIEKNVNLVDVFADSHRVAEGPVDPENFEFGAEEDECGIYRIGDYRVVPPDVESSCDILAVKALAALTDREKTCIRLWLKDTALKDIAEVLGFKGPSGVSYELEKIFSKMKKTIGSTGYPVEGDEEFVLESIERHLFADDDLLKKYEQKPF